MALSKARTFLFSLWAAFFLTYVLMILFTSKKEGVGFALASEAAWKICYVLLPILTAFASFWFSPRTKKQRDEDKKKVVEPVEIYAVFVLTGIFHVLVMTYFLLAVVLEDWAWLEPGPGRLAKARVSGPAAVACEVFPQGPHP